MTFSATEKAETIESFRAKIRALQSSQFPVWEMERLTKFVEFAIGKLSPLQVGDTAALTDTPEITPEKSWGWMGSKHFLVAGKQGVVRSVDWDDAFIFGWEPFDQTWIHPHTGEAMPVARPAIYVFGQRWLSKAGK